MDEYSRYIRNLAECRLILDLFKGRRTITERNRLDQVRAFHSWNRASTEEREAATERYRSSGLIIDGVSDSACMHESTALAPPRAERATVARGPIGTNVSRSGGKGDRQKHGN